MVGGLGVVLLEKAIAALLHSRIGLKSFRLEDGRVEEAGGHESPGCPGETQSTLRGMSWGLSPAGRVDELGTVPSRTRRQCFSGGGFAVGVVTVTTWMAIPSTFRPHGNLTLMAEEGFSDGRRTGKTGGTGRLVGQEMAPSVEWRRW